MKAVWQRFVQHKKWFILAVILAVAIKGGLAWQASSKAKAAANVKTAAVIRTDLTSAVSATGTIQPVNSVDVSSKVTGLIKETQVQENDTVKTGQVLVVLDDTRLQAQVSQARDRLANAAANLERNSRLSQIGAVSEQQLDSSRLDYNIAQANYDDAASQLDDTVIRAPIDGVVIGKPIPAGQTVTPGIANPMVILTIADLSQMQIETQVDESDIGKVTVGQKATFTVDAYPGKTFSGIVSSVSRKATVQQNVVYYGVIIDVDAGDQELKPTMTARVSISVGESKNALTVPLTAVRTTKNQQYVAVMKNGQSVNVNVTTGLTSEDRIEITSGLEDGDQIVISQPKAQQQQQQRGGMGLGPMGR
jgi:RND family efflux transporter, MFP subunit